MNLFCYRYVITACQSDVMIYHRQTGVREQTFKKHKDKVIDIYLDVNDPLQVMREYFSQQQKFDFQSKFNIFCTTIGKYTSYKIVKFRITVVPSWRKLALSAAHVCKLSIKKFLNSKRECMNKYEIYAKLMHFVPNASFLYPLKTSKSLMVF